jgi:hypothetical protein
MRRKIIFAAVVLVLGLAAGLGWTLTRSEEVGVSKLSNDPAAFVGKVKVTGKIGAIDAERGLLKLVDEKGCCSIILAVPLTQAQKEGLKADALFAGTLPADGSPVIAHGAIRKVAEGFRFDLAKVTGGGKTILRRI